MGNECNQCQPIPGCNREVVGRGLEKKPRLDLSRHKRNTSQSKSEESQVLPSIKEEKHEHMPQSSDKENNSPILPKEILESPPKGKVQLLSQPEKTQYTKVSLNSKMTYSGDMLPSTKQKQGKGKLQWEDGSTLEGRFDHNQIIGKIRFTQEGKGCYQGDTTNCWAQGNGRLELADGSIYEGEWFQDRPHGSGVHRLMDGAVYEGEFMHGSKSGKGRYTFVEGSFYEGNFLDGKFHGQGTLKTVDGRSYKGEWKEGLIHGTGKMVYDEENRYEGEFKEGKRQGQGTYFYGDGRYWSGQWFDNKQNGKGTYHQVDGSEIEGTWRDGKKVQAAYEFPLYESQSYLQIKQS